VLVVSNKETADKIKEVMKEKGIKPNVLAKRTIIQRQSVYNWLLGVKNFSPQSLVAICGAIGCEIEDVLVTEEVDDESN